MLFQHRLRYLIIHYLHLNAWQSRQLSYFTISLSHHYKSIRGLEMQKKHTLTLYSFHPCFSVKWRQTNRYLLRRTSVQSFRRCSSEGGLPCNTQLHFDSAESTLGLGKQAQCVIEYVCRFTESPQHSALCLHAAHTRSPLQPRSSRTHLSRSRHEITDCIFQPIFKWFNLPEGSEKNFTHRFSWMSRLAWLAWQAILARRTPRPNRTHVAHVPHVPFLAFRPSGARITCFPFLNKQEQEQKMPQVTGENKDRPATVNQMLFHSFGRLEAYKKCSYLRSAWASK